MKKVLLSLVMLATLVVFGATQVEAASSDNISVTVTVTSAAASVSVTKPVGKTWDIGSIAAGGTATASSGTPTYFEITNDTSNRTEDISIQVGSSTPSEWTAAGSAGYNTFVMEVMTTATGDLTSWTSIDSLQSLKIDLGPGANVEFDLQFTPPTSIEDATASETMTVTVSAS